MIKGELVTTSGAPAMPYIKAEMLKLKKELQVVKIRLPLEIKALGSRAGRLMAERVRRMTKRTGNSGDLALALETCMSFRKYGSTGFQAVMLTSSLPEYWAMINYGGFIRSGAVPGFWDDSPGGKSDGQKKTGGFAYQPGEGKQFGYMKPAKPIKGFHYMAFAYRKVLTEIRSGKFTRKIVPRM